METGETKSGGLLVDFSFIRGNFLIIIIGWLLVDFTREMAYTFYPLYVTELGGTATILGLISAAAVITEAVVKIPGGTLADKFRRKRLIIVMTLLASACTFYMLSLLRGSTSFWGRYSPASAGYTPQGSIASSWKHSPRTGGGLATVSSTS